MKTRLLIVLVCLVAVTGCRSESVVVDEYNTLGVLSLDGMSREGLMTYSLLRVERDTLLQVDYFLTGGGQTEGSKRFSLKDLSHAVGFSTNGQDVRFEMSFKGGWRFDADSSVVPVHWFFLRSRGRNSEATQLIKQ
jgi:hypothetical protein